MTDIPDAVLTAWRLDGDTLSPLGSGLINRTYAGRDADGRSIVLQQVNPIFPPAVNEDVAAVTAHLAARGMTTPRLLPAADGRLCLPASGGAWRVLTRVDGRSMERLERPAQARAAGTLLGQFHRALDDLDWHFRNPRPPIHELSRHLAALRGALARHRDHRLYAEVSPLAEAILAAAQALPALPETPPRVVHGDPKISNLVFAPDREEALCLVDLDTLGRMALPLELGDALRSWCNVSGEDSVEGRFDPELFEAALTGYAGATAGWITPAEASAIVPATATIQVELAARFCADALEERYFGWDGSRFASRGDHNRVRARGQLAVHRSLLSRGAELEERAAHAFAQ